MSMTPNSRGGNGGNGVVIMAGSNTPRLPGSALGLPDLVNRGQITGGNAANNSDYPSPYHSGTSGAGVVAKDNVYIVNYGTITAGRRFRRQRRRGQADRRWQSPGTGERIQHHGPYPSTGRNTLALNSADGKPTTASMTGDLYLGPGDTFEVRATPTAADRLDVNGKAQIHGTVSVVAGTGTYAESTRYTILTAQTLSNKFMSTTSNLAYLKPTVANEGNTVVLTLALRQAPKPDPDPDPVTPPAPSVSRIWPTPATSARARGPEPARQQSAVPGRAQPARGRARADVHRAVRRNSCQQRRIATQRRQHVRDAAAGTLPQQHDRRPAARPAQRRRGRQRRRARRSHLARLHRAPGLGPGDRQLATRQRHRQHRRGAPAHGRPVHGRGPPAGRRLAHGRRGGLHRLARARRRRRFQGRHQQLQPDPVRRQVLRGGRGQAELPTAAPIPGTT